MLTSTNSSGRGMARQRRSIWAIPDYTAKDAGDGVPVPVVASTGAAGAIVGTVYALLDLFLMMWWGYGGFIEVFPKLDSVVIQMGVYYLIEISLVQILLIKSVPDTRLWALLGFLSPWALVNLFTLPQFFHSPMGTLLFLFVPIFAIAIHIVLEISRDRLWSLR